MLRMPQVSKSVCRITKEKYKLMICANKLRQVKVRTASSSGYKPEMSFPVVRPRAAGVGCETIDQTVTIGMI